MELANILLDVGGDGTTIVSKRGVTPAEVAVLMAIHGSNSVSEIEVLEQKKDRTHRQEIAHLREVYGRTDPSGAKVAPAVDQLFPGVAARVFETFEELELDDSLYKAETRAVARPVAKKEDKGEKTLADMNIAALKTLADEENIDLQGVTKKADIIAAIEAARANKEAEGDEDDDEIEDMDEGFLG